MKKLLLLMLLLPFAMGAQTIESVSPNTGNLGQTLIVSITGEDTDFESISDTWGISLRNSQFQALIVNSFQALSQTEMLVSLTIPPSVSLGSYNLAVYWETGWTDLPNAFNVINTYNSISGNVTIDVDGNGCDASDLHMSGVKVIATDGTTNYVAFTDSSGNYLIYVPEGTYSVSPVPDASYYSSSPPSGSITFDTTNSLSETQDFCLMVDEVVNDLNVAMMALVPARPGFDAKYALVYRNNGNQIQSGSLDFVFDDTRLDFISATQPVASQTDGNLSWNFTDLMPFEVRTIEVTLNVNSPMETPAVNIGDILEYTATVNPVAGDATPENNVRSISQVVVGSYDPNDKSVAEGAEIPVANLGDYLHYLIRFQNEGTFLAETVRVVDMLQPTLDVSTLEVLSASHPFRASLTEGNKLEFLFENINLPPEIEDEPGSHGFVSFRIKPMNTVGVGTVIENTAEIFFDFNFPIITNTVETSVVLLSNAKFNAADSIVMYPNPVSDVLTIDALSLAQIKSVRIVNQLGQTVKEVPGSLAQSISVDDLAAGTYFVKVSSDKGDTTKKLIKW